MGLIVFSPYAIMKIGLLTGGGDCPGLNPAIRAVVRKCHREGFEVVGIEQGWYGLLHNLTRTMTPESVSGIIPLGGTILGTSRTNPAKADDLMNRVMENIKLNDIDCMVTIGGDDTLSVSDKLWERGVPVVGIPKTMDNDVALTDYCIGFDTAVTVVCWSIDRVHTTASSHHRVMIVEVMGRDAGWVALYGGLAGGADFILIPEVKFDIEEIAKHLKKRIVRKKSSSIIVVAEGAKVMTGTEEVLGEKDDFGHVRLDRKNVGEFIARGIEKLTGLDTRVTVLGHLQRGGSPTVFDRVLATRLGVRAVELVIEKNFGKMVAMQGRDIVAVELKDVIANSPRLADVELYKLAQLFY